MHCRKLRWNEASSTQLVMASKLNETTNIHHNPFKEEMNVKKLVLNVALFESNLLWLGGFWQISITLINATCYCTTVSTNFWQIFIELNSKQPLLSPFTNLRRPNVCQMYQCLSWMDICRNIHNSPKTSTELLIAACCLWRCRLIDPLTPYLLGLHPLSSQELQSWLEIDNSLYLLESSVESGACFRRSSFVSFKRVWLRPTMRCSGFSCSLFFFFGSLASWECWAKQFCLTCGDRKISPREDSSESPLSWWKDSCGQSRFSLRRDSCGHSIFVLREDALFGAFVQRLELVVLLCGSSEFAFDTITVISHQFGTIITFKNNVNVRWESDSASCQKSTGATFAWFHF